MEGELGEKLEFLRLQIEYATVASALPGETERFKSLYVDFVKTYKIALEKGLVYRDDFTDRHFSFLEKMIDRLNLFPREMRTPADSFVFDETINNCKIQVRELQLTSQGAPPGSDGERLPRLHRAQHAAVAAAGEAVLHGADVPARAAAEGALSAVLPDWRGDSWRAGCSSD